MGIFSFLGSCVSSVCRCVGGAVKAVGGLVGAAVKTVATGIAKVASVGVSLLKIAAPVVKAVASIVPSVGSLGKALIIASTICKVISCVFKILNPDEKIEDLGDRVLEASEQDIKPENFDNPDDYLEAVRRVDKSSDPNKHSYFDKLIAGISVCVWSLEKKFDINPELYNCFIRNHEFFTEDRIDYYLNFAKETKQDANILIDLFSSNATFRDKEKAEQFLITAEQKRDSNFNLNKFEKEITDAVFTDADRVNFVNKAEKTDIDYNQQSY